MSVNRVTDPTPQVTCSLTVRQLIALNKAARHATDKLNGPCAAGGFTVAEIDALDAAAPAIADVLARLGHRVDGTGGRA